MFPKKQLYFPEFSSISTKKKLWYKKKVAWNESSYSKIILQKIFQFNFCYWDKECFVMHKDIWYPCRDIFGSALISRMKIKIEPKRTMFFMLWTYFLFITTVFGHGNLNHGGTLKQYHNYEELTKCVFDLQKM